MMTFAEQARAKLAAVAAATLGRSRAIYNAPDAGEAEKITALATRYQELANAWWRTRTGLEKGDAAALKAEAAAARERLFRLLDFAMRRRVAFQVSVTRDWQRLTIGESKDYGVAGGATLEGWRQRRRFGRVTGRLNYFARKHEGIRR